MSDRLPGGRDHRTPSHCVTANFCMIAGRAGYHAAPRVPSGTRLAAWACTWLPG